MSVRASSNIYGIKPQKTTPKKEPRVRQVNSEVKQVAKPSKPKNDAKQVEAKKPIIIKMSELKPIVNVCDVINGTHPSVRLARKELAWSRAKDDKVIKGPVFEWKTGDETWSNNVGLQLFDEIDDYKLLQPHVSQDEHRKGDPYVATMSIPKTGNTEDATDFLYKLKLALDYNMLSVMFEIPISEGMQDKDFVTRVIKHTWDGKEDSIEEGFDVMSKSVFQQINKEAIAKTYYHQFFNGVKHFHSFSCPIHTRENVFAINIDFKYHESGFVSSLVKEDKVETLTLNNYLKTMREPGIKKGSIIFTPTAEMVRTKNSNVFRLNLRVRQLYLDNYKIVTTSWFTFDE